EILLATGTRADEILNHDGIDIDVGGSYDDGDLARSEEDAAISLLDLHLARSPGGEDLRARQLEIESEPKRLDDHFGRIAEVHRECAFRGAIGGTTAPSDRLAAAAGTAIRVEP